MEDRDVEFGLVAIFLIIASVIATALASSGPAPSMTRCEDACGEYAMDVLRCDSDRCICGGAGPVREISLVDASVDASMDSGIDAGADAGADAASDADTDAGSDAGIECIAE